MPLAARTLLEALPLPVLVVDDAMRLEAVNARGRDLLPSAQAGEPVSFALRAPAVLEAVRAVLGGGLPRAADYRERVPRERIFAVSVAPVPLAGGRAGAVLAFQELTAIREAERMRVDFVANASHELRTPLASMLGFVETMQGAARDDAAARERFLAIMREQGERMRRLIDDLLSLSRVEQRERVPPTAEVELLALAEEIAASLVAGARERSVAIRVMAPEPPYPVRGDRDELLRLLENLVENGVRYGGDAGWVEIALGRPAPGQVEIAVRDGGPGIAAEHLPRLTERFYRVDAGASRASGGTGLGLAIVKHITTRHRGRLAIESAPGRGTTFRVQLPALA